MSTPGAPPPASSMEISRPLPEQASGSAPRTEPGGGGGPASGQELGLFPGKTHLFRGSPLTRANTHAFPSVYPEQRAAGHQGHTCEERPVLRPVYSMTLKPDFQKWCKPRSEPLPTRASYTENKQPQYTRAFLSPLRLGL